MEMNNRWGNSTLLLCDGITQVELLRGWKGGASSCPRHRYKDSFFWLISGAITIHGGPLGQEDVLTELGPMESCEVPAGWWHRIMFTEHSTAIEVYRSVERLTFTDGISAMLNDIHRADIGVPPEEIPTL